MKKNILVFLFCCGMMGAMAGCSADGPEIPDAETGELTLRSLSMDRNTRSVDDLGLDPGTFSVEIIDARQSVVKTYPTFAEMPSKVRLPIGVYTVRASLGSATASGFDAWYFSGEKSVSILSRQVTNETVVCALANVKAAVVFGENLNLDFQDFSAEITSGEADPLLFARDENRAGYVPAGELAITIHMTNREGRQRSYTAQAYTAYPQEFVTFTIDTEDNPGDLNITITTDDISLSTEDPNNREVIIRLYDFMNAKAGPVVTGEGFNEIDRTLTYREGVRLEDARVNLHAEGTIRSCVVKPDAALQAQGWPAEFDLADPALDAGVAAALKTFGVAWYERMNGAVAASVDVRDAAAKLPWVNGEITPYTFTVQTTDSFGQTSGEETFTLAVQPPRMTLDAIQDYDMWAYKVDMKGSFSGIDLSALKLQYKTTGDWADCASATPVYDGEAVNWNVAGLTDDTDYQFRMVYGALESETRTARTEPAQQIPNGNFENWYEYKEFSNNKKNQWYLHPSDAATADRWWDTRNKATAGMRDRGTDSNYTNINTTSRVSSGGGYAAQLQSSSFGAGTTSSLIGCILTNVGAGFLFIGVNNGYSRHAYTYGTPVIGWPQINAERFYNESLTHGHAFPSRPAKLEFDYMYAPWDGESFLAYAVIESNGVEIARAQAANTAAAQGSMTRASFDFVYTNETLKATTIKAFFSSSDKLQIGIGSAAGRTPQFGPGEPTPTSFPAVEMNTGTGVPLLGSKLTIDNVTLNYNFD